MAADGWFWLVGIEADLDTVYLFGLVVALILCFVTKLYGLGVSSFYSRENHAKVGYLLLQHILPPESLFF